MDVTRLAALSARAATQDHVVSVYELRDCGFDKHDVHVLVEGGLLRQLFWASTSLMPTCSSRPRGDRCYVAR